MIIHWTECCTGFQTRSFWPQDHAVCLVEFQRYSTVRTSSKWVCCERRTVLRTTEAVAQYSVNSLSGADQPKAGTLPTPVCAAKKSQSLMESCLFTRPWAQTITFSGPWRTFRAADTSRTSRRSKTGAESFSPRSQPSGISTNSTYAR